MFSKVVKNKNKRDTAFVSTDWALSLLRFIWTVYMSCTSPYEWKILELDNKLHTTNQPTTCHDAKSVQILIWSRITYRPFSKLQSVGVMVVNCKCACKCEKRHHLIVNLSKVIFQHFNNDNNKNAAEDIHKKNYALIITQWVCSKSKQTIIWRGGGSRDHI